jgi:Cof subfamily protein (haloacid dehalogenase superfamily)
MIKHIFCDLDGTLLQDFSKIDENDIKALQLAQSKGVKISIATGRLDYEIKYIMAQYNLHGYRVSQNGGVVFNDQDDLIHEVSLTLEELQIILNVIKNFNVIVFFQTANEYLVEKKLQIVKDFEKTQSFITYVEKPNIYQELDQHDIISISLWAEKNENLAIKPYLDQVLPSHLESYVSSIYTLDITNKMNSKGNAIGKLCQINGISHDEIAVIGDSQNDISMFKLTKNSFVMDSARIEVKQEANHIVKQVKDAVNLILDL